MQNKVSSIAEWCPKEINSKADKYRTDLERISINRAVYHVSSKSSWSKNSAMELNGALIWREHAGNTLIYHSVYRRVLIKLQTSNQYDNINQI
jgi:hypothetical protein